MVFMNPLCVWVLMQSSKTPACPGWLMTAVAPWGENAEDALDQGWSNWVSRRSPHPGSGVFRSDLRPHRSTFGHGHAGGVSSRHGLCVERLVRQPASHGRRASAGDECSIVSTIATDLDYGKRFCCCEETSSVGWQVAT